MIQEFDFSRLTEVEKVNAIICLACSISEADPVLDSGLVTQLEQLQKLDKLFLMEQLASDVCRGYKHE